MATIRSRGRSGVFHALWYVSVPTADGKHRQKLMQRSTGKTNRRQAQDLADQWEKESKRPEREVSLDQARKVLAEMYRRATGHDAGDLKMTVREFGERWIRGKTSEVEKATIAFYKTSLKQFCAFLDGSGFGSRQIYEVTTALITDFRDALAADVSKTTANHHLKAIRMLFKAAKLEGWMPDNPADAVRTLKVRRAEKQQPRPFVLEQLPAILAACDDEWKSIVRLAFYTGKRLIDVALLMESGVDLLKKRIRWNIQKTDRTEFSPIHPALLEHLIKREWSDRGDRPMHPRSHGAVSRAVGSAKTSTLSKQFEHILIRAGIREVASKNAAPVDGVRRRPRNPYSFHSLRHTMATNLAALGVDRRVAMELVGHESEDVHEGYTHLPFELLREAIERLPSLDDP